MGEAGGPFSSFRDVHGPHPTLGGPGATRSVILMLAAGPGCCKHPYATLLQGLRVASNHCHLLAWHRAQAPSPGSRARQRLVLRRAPQAERGSSSSGRPLGEQKNKRQISLSLKKDQFHLRLSQKRGAGGETEKGTHGVLNIHELALHSSESWVMGEVARVGSVLKTLQKLWFLLGGNPLL